MATKTEDGQKHEPAHHAHTAHAHGTTSAHEGKGAGAAREEPKQRSLLSEKTVCIICQKEKPGRRVQEDFIINGIRAVKRRLGIASNNTLVVCGDCSDAHKKKREGFEKTMVQYGALGVIVAIIFIVISSFRLEAILFALFVGLVLFSFSILHYSPAVERGAEQ